MANSFMMAVNSVSLWYCLDAIYFYAIYGRFSENTIWSLAAKEKPFTKPHQPVFLNTSFKLNDNEISCPFLST